MIGVVVAVVAANLAVIGAHDRAIPENAITRPASDTLTAAVQAAVVRHMLPSPLPNGESVACVSLAHRNAEGGGVERRDPGQEVLSRVAVSEVLVAPGSSCAMDGPLGRMRHIPSGGFAALYIVGDPGWHGADSVEVYGAWFRGSLYGASCQYDLRREGNRWNVIRCRNPIES